MRMGVYTGLLLWCPHIRERVFILAYPDGAERRSYQRDSGQKGRERLTLLGHARLHHYGFWPRQIGGLKAGFCDSPNASKNRFPDLHVAWTYLGSVGVEPVESWLMLAFRKIG